ncbi:unnamed protein product [Candidula unifasciata]|uniref:Uncharacterized protein n=1 Tax=Candidula unifasciata TaxID=100452 RepID=A0A8S3ZXK5_9EUPU|nr:unnamed protein product [Candidula unifasciata]
MSLGDTVILNERRMTHGVIPVKQSSLPGLIRLPRRYDTDSVNVPVYSNHPTAIQPHCPENESVSERLKDLMQATLWLKQELILLRQHDILLKRAILRHPLTPITSLQPQKIAVTSMIASIPSPSLHHHRSKSFHLYKTYSPSHSPDWVVHLETLLVRPIRYTSVLQRPQRWRRTTMMEGCDFLETKYHSPRAASMRTSRDLAAAVRSEQ